MNFSSVIHRIDKLFPELKEGEAINNELLKTIKVPKDLLFLTKRLPRPNYNEDYIKYETVQSLLPTINSRPIISNRYKNISNRKYEYEDIQPTKINPVLNKYKVNLNENPVNNNDEEKIKHVSLKKNKANIKNSHVEDYEYSPDFECDVKEDSNNLEIGHEDKNYNRKINKVLKHRNIERKQKINKSTSPRNLIGKEDYKSDSRIHKIINKKNKELKLEISNMKLLENEYLRGEETKLPSIRKSKNVKRSKLNHEPDKLRYEMILSDVENQIKSKKILSSKLDLMPSKTGRNLRSIPKLSHSISKKNCDN